MARGLEDLLRCDAHDPPGYAGPLKKGAKSAYCLCAMARGLEGSRFIVGVEQVAWFPSHRKLWQLASPEESPPTWAAPWPPVPPE